MSMRVNEICRAGVANAGIVPRLLDGSAYYSLLLSHTLVILAACPGADWQDNRARLLKQHFFEQAGPFHLNLHGYLFLNILLDAVLKSPEIMMFETHKGSYKRKSFLVEKDARPERLNCRIGRQAAFEKRLAIAI
jgi:hypothetical protein